jgi:hypothetical protein
MGDIRFVVRKYIGEGLVCLPVKPGEKATRFKDWQKPDTKPTEQDFEADYNVAQRLDNVVDIDCDCHEARYIAERLLPLTPRKHGRPSLAPYYSHHWYTVTGDTSFKAYYDLDGKTSLVEHRTGCGHYTVIPPSVVLLDKHAPDKGSEALLWDGVSPDGARDLPAPANVDAAGLFQAARWVACASMLARYWPQANRHNTTLAFAGMMFKLGAQPMEVEQMLRAVTALKHPHDGPEGWSEIPGTVRSTYDAFKADRPHVGSQELAKLIAQGEDVVKRIFSWFGEKKGKGKGAYHMPDAAELDAITESLNERHFLVRIGKDELVGTEEGGEVYFQPEKALHLRYANQKKQVGKREETAFSIWRANKNRRDYRTITFAPHPKVAHPRDYNLWKGLAVEPTPLPEGLVHGTNEYQVWISDVVMPKCIKYLSLIHDVICGGEPARQEEYFDYLLDLLALTLQRPGEPSEVAVVLKGDRGAGKGMFIRNFGSLFGRHFAQISKPEQIVGKFNATCSGKVVIFADEAFYAGDKKSLGALKVVITEPRLAIERKGVDPVQEDNFVHLFMASNEDWHTPAGMQERRFFVLSVASTHMQDADYFEAIAEEMKNGGREAFARFLLDREITDEKRKALRRAPRTDELRVQQEASLPAELRWWKQCLREAQIGDMDWPDYISVTMLHENYLRWCDDMKVNHGRITLVDLGRRVLKPWLGKERKIPGQDVGTLRRVRNLPSINDARATFDRMAGTTTPWDEDVEQDDVTDPTPTAGQGPQNVKPGRPDLPF